MKESTIFKYVRFHTLAFGQDYNYCDNECNSVEANSFAFGLGCWDAYNGNGYSVDKLFSFIRQKTISKSQLKFCFPCYDIGYMHTLKKADDDDAAEKTNMV